MLVACNTCRIFESSINLATLLLEKTTAPTMGPKTQPRSAEALLNLLTPRATCGWGSVYRIWLPVQNHISISLVWPSVKPPPQILLPRTPRRRFLFGSDPSSSLQITYFNMFTSIFTITADFSPSCPARQGPIFQYPSKLWFALVFAWICVGGYGLASLVFNGQRSPAYRRIHNAV